LKRGKISNNVIRRLPRYLQQMEDLAKNGVDHISSKALGRQMGLTPSQIRQDFSCYGEFGQQGWGYSVPYLREQISAILGMKRGYRLILVGIGNLGHALLKNFGFERYGFTLAGAFDVNPELVGTELSGLRVAHIDTLEEFLKMEAVDIAVLTVPGDAADATAKQLARCGVRAIWNFTNTELAVSRKGTLVENIHFSDSLLSLSYFLTESLDAT